MYKISLVFWSMGKLGIYWPLHTYYWFSLGHLLFLLSYDGKGTIFLRRNKIMLAFFFNINPIVLHSSVIKTNWNYVYTSSSWLCITNKGLFPYSKYKLSQLSISKWNEWFFIVIIPFKEYSPVFLKNWVETSKLYKVSKVGTFWKNLPYNIWRYWVTSNF